MENKVAISTLPFNFEELRIKSKLLKDSGTDFLHCDIMDGKFVENKTFMPDKLENLATASELPLDVHLMVVEPAQYFKYCKKTHSISIHCEVFDDLNECRNNIELIKNMGIKAGVAIDLNTPAEAIVPLLHIVDLVLVMSVKAGAGGQKFDASALEKIKLYHKIKKEKSLNFEIEVDGGINADNAQKCIQAGADILVSGSYVAKSTNAGFAIDSLKYKIVK